MITYGRGKRLILRELETLSDMLSTLLWTSSSGKDPGEKAAGGYGVPIFAELPRALVLGNSEGVRA